MRRRLTRYRARYTRFRELQAEDPEALERLVAKARPQDWWLFCWVITSLVLVNAAQGRWGHVLFGIPFIYFMLRRERSFDTDVES